MKIRSGSSPAVPIPRLLSLQCVAFQYDPCTGVLGAIAGRARRTHDNPLWQPPPLCECHPATAESCITTRAQEFFAGELDLAFDSARKMLDTLKDRQRDLEKH